jgi:O-antigen/teichoic acid export membrane protein
MFSKIQKLNKSSFVKNVAVMTTGTAASQAVTIAFAPLITRIYGPEAFGILGAFLAILAIFSPMASLSYPVAIVLPKNDPEALGLIKLSLVVAVLVSLLLAIYFFIFGEVTSKTLNIEELAPYLYLIPIATLLIAFHQIMEQWLIRYGDFKKIAVVVFANSIAINCLKAGLGLLSPVGKILIFATIAGNLLQVILLFIGLNNKKEKTLSTAEGLDLKVLFLKYKDFPLYRAPQSCINAISQSLPVLMLANLFGPVSAGFYVLAKMVMGVPSGLLGKSVGDVFYPKITQAKNRGEHLAPLIKNATTGLLLIGVLPFSTIIIFGPQIFSLFFGQDWLIAGEYARWLSFFFLFNFINRPCVAAVPILNLQKGLLIYEFFSTGTKVLALLIGFYIFRSDVVAVALFSLFGVVAYSVMMLWIYNLALRMDRDEKAS